MVSFGQIEIREYPRCLGDNPSVTVGPPISMGWKHDQAYRLDLSEYEIYRNGGDVSSSSQDEKQQQQQQQGEMTSNNQKESDPEQQQQHPRTRRRCAAEFQLPSRLRFQILRDECAPNSKVAQAADTCCTETQIKDCLREIQLIKSRRRSSFAMHELEHIQILVESAVRKFRRFVAGISYCSSNSSSSSPSSTSEDATTTIANVNNDPG